MGEGGGMTTKKRIALAKKIAADLFAVGTFKVDRLQPIRRDVITINGPMNEHYPGYTQNVLAVRVLRVLEGEGV